MGDLDITSIRIRTPKQVLHFSDGILEIFDDDEADAIGQETKPEEPAVNEKDLTWTPWLIYKAQRLGSTVLSGLDYTGEKLADILHITTPKYAYEINQYKKDQARKALEEQQERDNTWKVDSATELEPITKPPVQSSYMKV